MGKEKVMADAPNFDSTKDHAATLRAALVGLIGSDDEDELRQMEEVLSLIPSPDSDKTVTINAIHALQATRGK